MRRYLVATVVMALLLSAGVVRAPVSGADQLGDKQAQAEQISRRLSELDTEMESLGEGYNQARVRLEQVQADIDEAAKRADAANAELAQRRAQLARYAVAAYIKGGQSDLPDILLKGSGPEVTQQIEYLKAASANERELVDGVRAAQGTADTQLADLRTDRARAESLRDELSQKKDHTEKASAEQQALLDRVTGEMAPLVAEAQARQAQADEAAGRARLASLPIDGSGPGAGTSAPPVPRPGSTIPVDNPGGPDLGPGPTAPPTTRPGAPPAPPPVVVPKPPGMAPPVLAIAARAVALAETQLGVPYLWAGDNPTDGFDCSGLLVWAWKGVGKILPHSSELMYQITRRIALSDLQPGDFLFYGAPIHHVAMYVGGGRMIEAPHTGAFVRYASIYRSDLVGAGRVV
jgi:cell wall-associated NlpC family hydrolase